MCSACHVSTFCPRLRLLNQCSAVSRINKILCQTVSRLSSKLLWLLRAFYFHHLCKLLLFFFFLSVLVKYRKIPKISPGAFTLYLRAISKYKPPGGLYLEGRFNGGVFALPVWGAYIWRGLYLEGLIFGILRYRNIEKICPLVEDYKNILTQQLF